MRFGLVLLLSFVAAPLAAQMTAERSGGAVAAGAATITEADVARRIGIIAHDSMLGRDTPSRGLEMTAQYIADEFKRLGLKPGGDNGTWFQRYPIIQTQMDVPASHIGIMAGGGHAHAQFATDAFWLGGPTSKGEIGGQALVVSGAADSAAIAAASKGRVVLYVADFTRPASSRTAAAVLSAAAAGGAKAMLRVSNRDNAVFERGLGFQLRPRSRLPLPGAGRDPAIAHIEVRESALTQALRDAGVNVAELRASNTATVKPLDGLRMMVDVKFTTDTAWAPNTIGILEGSDPTLKSEYIVFTAHMDHDGIKTPLKGTTDSIWNGADDDASGTIGVVELAEAYAQQGARPKRSLVFMTVSGEEKGLWGSRWYSEHPTLPLAQTVANINMDMIGRNWTDTIVVIGKEHSDLGKTLNRVNTAHPELGMTAIDDIWPEENFYRRSDHFNFARKGVPILFFFNGTHVDYHQPTDEPAKIDAEKESRILQLVYYLGQDIGNAAARPKWVPASYEEIVEK